VTQSSRGLRQALQTYTGTLAQIRRRPFPSKSFPIYDSLEHPSTQLYRAGLRSGNALHSQSGGAQFESGYPD
jgi:hypothetical protein